MRAIAVGEPKHAARYCPDLAPHAECYPAGRFPKLYGEYGISRSPLQLLDLKLGAEGAKAAKEGFLPEMPNGDPFTQPATFIVDTAGIIQYAYYAPSIADHPDLADIIAAAQRIKSQ